MNGPVSLPPLQALSLSSQLAGRLALTPDSLIQATVTRVQGAQVTLNVQGQPLQARSDLPLTPGQRLTFLVQFANNQWRLIPQPTTPAPAAATTPAPLAALTAPPVQALQTTLTQLLQALPAAAQGNPAIALLSEKLQQHLLKPDVRLSPEQLRTALSNSGVQMEARLAANQPVAQDLKATLLQLLAQARKEKRETLIEPIRKLLRRIEHHQARSLIEQGFSFPLLFEPEADIRDGSLSIYPPRSDDAEMAWRALLQLDFRQNGPFEALIQLMPDQLKVSLWAADPIFSTRVEQLQSRLQALTDQLVINWQEKPPSKRITATVLSVRTQA